MLVRSAGKGGPRAVLDLGYRVALVVLDAQALLGWYHDVVALELHLAAEPVEYQPRHAQVVGHYVANAQLAAGAGRKGDEASDLDVVRADREVGATKPPAPCTTSTFEPIPSIRAPICSRSLARS